MDNTRTNPTDWSQAIRRLHFTVAVLVTLQIVAGLVMSHQTPWLMQTHFYLGLTIAALVLIHWYWLLTRERVLLTHLFPWSPRRLAGAVGDIRSALKGQLPRSGPSGSALAGLVHGLGLLALTAVAALGTTIFILIRLHQARSGLSEVIRNIHVVFAWILIVYWCGHVLLAVVHEARGDHVIARMFGRSQPRDPEVLAS
ncbi:MAG: cytochrome b/b6 domain-containing protein [Gammaproteobacteria bacterium]